MGRRARGEGSVYRRRSDGLWVGTLSLPDGSRKPFYGKKQSEVLDKLERAKSDLRRGQLAGSNSNTTVKEYLEDWLENIHKPTIRLSTYLDYRKVLKNYLVPGFGKVKLKNLSPQLVQAFYTQKINEGLAPKTVRNIHGVLHKALENAVKWNLLPRNVCDAVAPPRLPHKEQSVLTKGQAHTLLDEVIAHRLEALLALAVTTGLRQGELLALRWRDIDFESRSVQVKRQVGYFKGYGRIESEPKTEKGRRSVALSSFVLDILKHHKARQEEQQREVGSAWIEKDLVFTNAQGDFYSASTLRKVFRRFLTSIGLPRLRFHDLRHSAATILLELNTHPKVVSEMLGHSDIRITLGLYSHVLPSMQEEVAKRWDSEFGGPVKKRGTRRSDRKSL
jgi:integrase